MISKKKYQRLPLSTLLIYALYQTIFPFFVIYGLLIALKRSLKEPSHLKRLSDRFGLGPIGEKGAIWIYAASLGEMNAARPLVQVFLDHGHFILLTHLSPAGLEAGQKFFGDNPKVTHRYMPLDFFLLIQLFLRRSRPSCGIVLEVEIWPSMLMEADRLGVPMYLANGNLPAVALPRLDTLGRHRLYMFRLFDHILTRTENYADHYKATGVQSKDITVTGDLRFDIKQNVNLIKKGQSLRKAWAKKSFNFMLASSVQAEEDILIKCCAQLLKKAPKIRIIWVPRSPQRFEAVNRKVIKAGISSMRRSELVDDIKLDAQIFIGDSLGEMDLYLGLADIVFVGASFIDGGGHNIIEPLKAGCPVVMGYSTLGVDFIAEEATQVGVFHKFQSPQRMVEFLLELSQKPSKVEKMQALTTAFASVNKSVAEQCYKVIMANN